MRISFVLAVLAASVAFGSEWGQWRGPYLNGTSDETNLPTELGPNSQLWQTALPGVSAATPVVFADHVYLPSTESGSKRLLALCVDAATGEILWKRAVGESAQQLGRGNTMASGSACADETGVVFLFGDGTLIKFNVEGEPIWRRNIVEAYGPLVLNFGFSSSPLLYGGKLYISVLRTRQPRGSAELASYLLCVDNANGETIFKHDRPTEAVQESTNAYNTPIPATFNGQMQIVVYGADYLTAHDPADGHELWRYEYSNHNGMTDRVVPTPAADESRVYCPYPRGTKTFAVAVGTEPEQAWVHDVPGPDVCSPALYKGNLYQVNDQEKTLACIEAATGSVRWIGQLDKSDMYYASVTAADDKLYMVNRRGVVTVAAAHPAEFRILSTLNVGERPVDSTITVANGRVFLRTAKTLYCWGTSGD